MGAAGDKNRGGWRALKGREKMFATLEKRLSPQQNSSAPEAEKTREGGGQNRQVRGQKTLLYLEKEGKTSNYRE